VSTYHSYAALKHDLSENKTTCVKVVEDYLSKIKKESHLNAFLEVFEQSALKQAAGIDKKIASGNHGKLAGMVVGLKDVMCYKDHRVSSSSKILDGFVSLYDATVVQRLLEQDAIIIGRLNCDEFAMGSSNENSAYGNVLNPVNVKCVPGGSSGGSVAAVAAGLCMATLGTDTGGSIRQPASFTGVVGFKPTYGRVSRYGIIAYASSFDQVGPITNNIEDAALLLEVIAGKDEYDSTVSSKPVPEYSTKLKFDKKVKVAYIKQCLENKGLNAEVKTKTLESIEWLKGEGHTVEPVDFPYLDYMVPCYYVLTTAEASSNLGRYDGVHYGYRSKNAFDLESTYKKSRSEGFGTEVKRRIMLGTFVLSAGYYDAYYTKGQKVRRLIKNKTEEILSQYDFILMPSTPNAAFEFGQHAADPIAMYLEDIFTVQANLAGLPAISLPVHKKKDGMPFGLQLMGKSFGETELLAFSDYLMKNIK
jgi:aspartyl-tRNA(Asn)/glutamyl-tRNA(Gln) amidotransferase subunit A